MRQINLPAKKEFRRELRKSQTIYERKLWYMIKNNQLGLKFRRQISIGGYIVDFYCSQLKLAIEIDGEQHYTREGIKYDNLRTSFLNAHGIEVIRFSNYEIVNEIDDVLKIIENRIKQR